MTRFQTFAAAIAVSVPAIANAATAAPAKLDVAFSGIETQQGIIMIAVFASEDAYNGKGAPAKVTGVRATGAEVKAAFEGLPAGRYAMKIFHDIDSDGKMSANPFGIPTEPFAFSNNAVGDMGPASWTAAAFDVKPGSNLHSITIK